MIQVPHTLTSAGAPLASFRALEKRRVHEHASRCELVLHAYYMLITIVTLKVKQSLATDIIPPLLTPCSKAKMNRAMPQCSAVMAPWCPDTWNTLEATKPCSHEKDIRKINCCIVIHLPSGIPYGCPT